MDVELDVKNEIDFLTDVAINEIKCAFKDGDEFLYGRLGERYGPIAHRVYMSLDIPSKSEQGFFDNKSVLLDPWTVINRSESLRRAGKDPKPINPEFWNHSDLIKSLVDYLLLISEKETLYAKVS